MNFAASFFIKFKHIYPIAILFVLSIITALLSLGIGEMKIPLASILHFLNDGNTMEYSVLHHIRIPRALLAIAIGGSLSLSGVILQGIYRNPLAEPYTLGISGGASLGITLAIVTGFYAISMLALPFAGFVGAFASIFFVYTLSIKRGAIDTNRMLLIGVMISFISSSFVMFLMSITSAENIPGIIFWTMGSLNESNPALVNGILILSVVSLAASYLFAGSLNALRLGEIKAKHLGINTQKIIRLLFILTSLLTGSCIAVAGVIGFVGLIIPHFSRLWVGNDYRMLLITSFLSGSIFLLLCDILARILMSPNELPIGVITGIVGGIVFIFIISRSQIKSRTQ
ncbi:ferric citrate ABC transporter permease [Bacteroidales bacterium]|nr:ferric citrate ABC transporter permease [Bacteroidales bacterium]